MCLIKLNKDFKLGLNESTIILTSLLHDLCKVNNYTKVKKVFKDDDSNTWYDYITYETSKDISIPLGHGEKSVMMILEFIKLSDLEKLMIRWHMGAFEEGSLSNGLSSALDYHNGVLALHLADSQASRFLEATVNHREIKR